MKRFAGLALAAFLMTGAPAMAQEPHAQPHCPADAEPLPPALSGWAARSPMIAATDSARLAGASLTLGKAVDLTLAPTPDVHYALRPENPGGSVSNGGMASFTVEQAGTYRVAISSAAWIDVIHDGAALTSTAHGHGPACSGIRKMVDFALQPGSYVFQVAGNGTPALSVLVTRLP